MNATILIISIQSSRSLSPPAVTNASVISLTYMKFAHNLSFRFYLDLNVFAF